jgi:hypothetical protein
VTRRLWFDLAATLRLAEHTRTSIDFIAVAGIPDAPCLIADTGVPARLWSNALPQPAAPTTPPQPDELVAAHVDDASRRGGTHPSYCLPLTESDEHSGVPLLDLMRRGACEGDRWFTIDADTTPPHCSTRAAYHTSRVPVGADWMPALVGTDRLGPYPGQIARGYHYDDAVLPRFDIDTVRRIAADTETLSDCGEVEVVVVAHDAAGGPHVVLLRGPGSAVQPDGSRPLRVHAIWDVDEITADADGMFGVGACAWPWRRIDPPVQETSALRGDTRVPVFEPDRPDGGSLCTVCGATGYDIADQQVPSMAGYGHDHTTRCRVCGSSETTGPIYHWQARRAVWPPSNAAAAGEHPAETGR